jgi:integrase
MSVVRRGGKWCIRYYGPDGRQRWETVGPNKKEAETVLHPRLYEVRSGIVPILRRRSRITFEAHAQEWMTTYAAAHVRISTRSTYEWLLDDHLLPEFGPRSLSTITAAQIQTFLAAKREHLAPRTANHALALLREILEAGVTWGRLPTNPARGIRRIPTPQRDLGIWTIGEIRKFLLAADERWQPVFTVALFTGQRVGEIQAMAWDNQDRPNSTTNKIEVSCSYSHRARAMGQPKTDHSRRTIDMTPTVRHTLQSLTRDLRTSLVFPGRRGGVLSQPDISEGFHQTITRAKVSRIRFHDCRHIFASLLIAAGKNVKYVATQLGHHSASFTPGTYGHLMDRLPVQPVEWIDDLVFLEGFEAALKLPLYGARSDATGGHAVQPPEERESNNDAVWHNVEQPDATGFMVGRAGLEPATLGLRVPCTASCANGPGAILTKTLGTCKRERMSALAAGAPLVFGAAN